ncbi:MAG: S-layer homology domain-containing protein, partial [Tissierellia bacterium]|nr:S-layer homology domain-containing protein [Tissierellia bacterium]
MFKMKTMVLTITIVALALFLAGNHVLAATFSDVPANHWAKSYIDRCTNEGIIKGYPDNTFKPSNEISFTEISSLLSGLLNVTESEMQAANTTYGQKIIQLNVPDWARPAVLKCLYKGVYSLSNLETAANAGMLDDTKGMAVTRANCAVFFSQAMGLSSQMGTTGLTYHDLNSISESARPHIVALQKVGVLSAQGDGYGYFHPMNGIDRASIAKMLTVAIDYLKKNPGTTPTPTPTVSIKTVSGHVKNISSFGGQNYIIITKSDGKDEAYSIDVSTKVTVDTLPAFVTQIKEGMEATITYDDATKKAMTGIFKMAESKVEGIIYEIPRYGKKVEVEYKSGSTTKTEEFDF